MKNMKSKMYKLRAVLIITLTNLLIITSVRAQSPEKMSYQAVIRNSSDQLVTSHAVGMQISILQTTSTGTAVYVETHTATTNANGLVTIEIGGGTPVTGTLAAIDWSAGPYFIKTETDPAGGTNYTITGTSQLLSVPYAFYATTAENGFSGNYNDLTNKPTTDGSETKVTAGTTIIVTGAGTTANPYVFISSAHYIGEIYGGGIIVAVWQESGVETGLIASLTDLSSMEHWSNVTGTLIGPAAQSPVLGQANTDAIIAQSGHISSAAKLCADYTSGIYSDWYLPAAWELNQCYNAASVVNTMLGAADGFGHPRYYWSSTESDSDGALIQNFIIGSTDYLLKDGFAAVRAVRRF
jgi:hypothetical protein